MNLTFSRVWNDSEENWTGCPPWRNIQWGVGGCGSMEEANPDALKEANALR